MALLKKEVFWSWMVGTRLFDSLIKKPCLSGQIGFVTAEIQRPVRRFFSFFILDLYLILTLWQTSSLFICVYLWIEFFNFVSKEGDALLGEMEFTGQAFEEMQDQNIQLMQQLREKDDANLKLMSEVRDYMYFL